MSSGPPRSRSTSARWRQPPRPVIAFNALRLGSIPCAGSRGGRCRTRSPLAGFWKRVRAAGWGRVLDDVQRVRRLHRRADRRGTPLTGPRPVPSSEPQRRRSATRTSHPRASGSWRRSSALGGELRGSDQASGQGSFAEGSPRVIVAGAGYPALPGRWPRTCSGATPASSLTGVTGHSEVGRRLDDLYPRYRACGWSIEGARPRWAYRGRSTPPS